MPLVLAYCAIFYNFFKPMDENKCLERWFDGALCVAHQEMVNYIQYI